MNNDRITYPGIQSNDNQLVRLATKQVNVNQWHYIIIFRKVGNNHVLFNIGILLIKANSKCTETYVTWSCLQQKIKYEIVKSIISTNDCNVYSYI